MAAQATLDCTTAAEDELVVRPLRREDVPVVLRLIHELAEYEGEPEGPKLSERDLLEDGFECSPAWFFGLVAERRGEVVGHALCNRAYSSWTRRAFYIEDLFVRPAARRAGVGLALVRALCQMAVKEGVNRIDWHVLADNAPALAFYARLGAHDMLRAERRAAMRLDRRYIEAVARCSEPSDLLGPSASGPPDNQ
ncbi:diamine acetyltransferase 1-like [Epargyreus clarus]|uniref:diamine acetyltransferase 1-like n=1 Tax=Epargyreus clarus TaxID=520877 RepID=UPI003C2F088A